MIHSWKIISGAVLLAGLLFVGCQSKPPTSQTTSTSHEEHGDHHGDDAAPGDQEVKIDAAKEAKISSVLSKLSSEDRELAESQKFCAVMSHERLGAMGPPIKLDIKGTPVFVCCKGCKQKALKTPEETLKRVAAMKEKNKTAVP